jgi:hypothetical protein
MKILFDSLDPMLDELRERKVEAVRVARAVHVETGRPTGGIPHLTVRVVVTAAVDEHLWVEWRFWVGRAIAEVGAAGLQLPARLKERGESALADVRERVTQEGFRVRDGLLAHDMAAIDGFRL